MKDISNPLSGSLREPVSIVLCGAGGWGERYIPTLLSKAAGKPFRLTAVIDPHPEGCTRLQELRDARIPLFESLEKFYAQSTCDLMILSTPIHLHSQQACLALAHGSHVLCEKPLCVTLEQIRQMEAAEKRSGKTVTLGYQWSFSPAIGRLKRDCLAGRFGAAKRLRTLVCWPRDEIYYQRNRWAGKIRLESGQLVLDSPVNNATAHFLHNMLYLLGASMAESALPKRVEAELWRAQAIENYDTAALRIELESGAEALFLASHSTYENQGPTFVYEFEQATISYNADDDNLRATFHDGRVIDYGSPEAEPFKKIGSAIDSVRTGKPGVCGIAAAKAHTLCVIEAQESAEGIRDFPPEAIALDFSGPVPRRYVLDLNEIIDRCYVEGKLFSEDEGFLRLCSRHALVTSGKLLAR